MNRETREAVLSDDYVIQVTAAGHRFEIESWIDYMEKKGLDWTVKEIRSEHIGNTGRFELWRKMTEREKEECREGRWSIQRGSFKNHFTEGLIDKKEDRQPDE